MKNLFASTAIALAFGAPVFAQTTTAATDSAVVSPFVGSIDTEALRASDLIGARLYVSENDVDAMAGRQQDWNDVGEISDIVIGGGGDIDAVLADIGGFLGIGERTIAVSMNDLNFVSDGPDAVDYFVVLKGNRAELENAPEFNADFQRGYARNGIDPMVGGTGTDTQAGASNVVVGGNETSLKAGAVVDNPQTPATAVVTEGGTVVTTTDSAAVDATTTMDATTTDAVTAATSEATTPMTTDGTVVAADTATDDTVAPATGMAGMGAMMAPPMMARDGYKDVAYGDLTTEQVTGASVYDANDKRVGEIGELVMSQDGKLQDAIIDVGGFLGLGEKPVAVSFESLQILTDDAGGDVRVYVDTTEDQLKALPEYNN